MHLITETWRQASGIRLSGVHSTRPLVRLVGLVPMEYHLFHWHSIGEMHLITETYNISFGFRLSLGAFYSSIGMIGTNGTVIQNIFPFLIG